VFAGEALGDAAGLPAGGFVTGALEGFDVKFNGSRSWAEIARFVYSKVLSPTAICAQPAQKNRRDR
jgi:hypothetical protein